MAFTEDQNPDNNTVIEMDIKDPALTFGLAVVWGDLLILIKGFTTEQQIALKV